MVITDNTPSLLANTEILKFKGIYAIGSDQERFIYTLRDISAQFHQEADSLSIQVMLAGKFSESEILPRIKNSGLWETSVPPSSWGEVAAFRMFDGPDLVKFDARLRWCRMVLNNFESTESREEIRKIMASVMPRSAFWYAAKCLMHADRVFEIVNRLPADKGISDFSLFGMFRELIAFGETWSEANFIVNHGDAAISGRKYHKKSQQGAALRRGDFADHTPDVIREMRRLVEAGQTASAAARITAVNGLGTSEDANRALWQRHKRKL